MEINKTLLIGIIVGIFIALFAYVLYVNIQFQKAFQQDHQVLAQIVQIINNAQKAQQPAPAK